MSVMSGVQQAVGFAIARHRESGYIASNVMRWRAVFIVSACINVALLAAVAHYARTPDSPPATNAGLIPATNGTQRTHVVVRRQFFTWDQVESADYPTFIANLRDIGCPEQTIRDIIIADVNNLYAKRAATEVRTPGQQWWRTGSDPEVTREAIRKLRELERERRELLTRLLGPGWDESRTLPGQPGRTGVALDGPVLGPLANDVKLAVNSVVVESQNRMEALQARAAAEGRKPTAAELAALREQTRHELQRILSPAQVEEFLLRYSQNASELRAELDGLRYFNTTPEEFRAMFRASDQFDQKIAALADSTDPNDVRHRQSLEAQREAALKQALGPERYALYTQLQNPNFQRAYAQALAAGDPSAAQAIYQLNQATAAELAKLQVNTNLTPEQQAVEAKRLELEQLKATALALGQTVPPDPDAPPEPPEPPQNRVHTIRPGDTFGALSTAYNVPVNVILDANPGLQINNLKPGQQIIIPPEAGTYLR